MVLRNLAIRAGYSRPRPAEAGSLNSRREIASRRSVKEADMTPNVSPDRDQELSKARWLRDQADEVATSLPPGEILTAARLRHGVDQLIDLIEGGYPPRP